jgi:hypothetical protein
LEDDGRAAFWLDRTATRATTAAAAGPVIDKIVIIRQHALAAVAAVAAAAPRIKQIYLVVVINPLRFLDGSCGSWAAFIIAGVAEDYTISLGICFGNCCRRLRFGQVVRGELLSIW